MDQKSLAKLDEGAFPALASAGLPEAIRENIGNDEVTQWDLPQVRVPSGGGLSWEVPSLDGDSDSVKELVGVVVYSKLTRSYWRQGIEESGGNTPPDCQSPDSVHGFGEPGGLCRECVHAQWGSDGDGRGQACKQQRPVFLLQEGGFLPLAVIAPATSLSGLKQYFLRLGGQGKRYWHVVTALRLVKAVNRNGISYSKIVPSLVGELSPEQAQAASAYKASLEASLSQYHEAAPTA